MHEFTSVRDLEASIARFLERATAGSYLVIQADTASVSVRRIQHARYLLEKAWAMPGNKDEVDEKGDMPPAQSWSKKGVHVLLLVHLNRADNTFSFDFDTRWRYVFLDTLEPAQHTGLPGLSVMLDATLTDIIAQTDVTTVLQRHFRTSLTRMLHAERSETTLRSHIELLRDTLGQARGLFPTICRDLVVNIIRASQVDSAFNPSQLAGNELALFLSGTFTNVLHQQLTDVITLAFAALLAHMDRNGNLQLLNPSLRLQHRPLLVELWLELLPLSFSMGETAASAAVSTWTGQPTVGQAAKTVRWVLVG